MYKKILDAKILIIDDDEDDFIITSEYIRSFPGNLFQIDWCNKYNEGLKFLLERKYDLYFVDYRLGAKTGVDFLKEAYKNNCNEPIILLTGKGNYHIDIEAMQYGAFDYLVKTEISVDKMERCIRYSLDRAQTLKELKANEHKYRTIFEKSKDIIFIADYELNFIDINIAIEDILGFKSIEIIGTNLCDLIDNVEQKTFISSAIKECKEFNDKEIIFNTKYSDKKYCTLTYTFESKGKFAGYIQGIIHDISNLKKIEKATLQSEKLAAASRLVRTIAHEVRNPLNNITLAAEQLNNEEINETQNLYLDIIQRNSKRINQLITELLYTSRTLSIQLKKEPIQVIIDDVINAALDRLTLKHINLHLSYPNKVLTIFCDRINIKLALLNIVINAIEAMDEHLGRLEITVVEDNLNAILSIKDNGCGITEENLGRLFEPYFTQKRNGVGLGLAFTFNILQAHKATVDVDTKLGEGTTFAITFPLFFE